MTANFTDFKKDVIDASYRIPVIVDFWAEWCAPCRMLSPVLEKLAKGANGKWRLVKINTEQQPRVALEWRIQSIPAVKMFSDGKVIAEFVGALPESTIVRWLDQNLPSASKKAVQAALEALHKGDNFRAKRLVQNAIDQDSSNLEAKILLAQLIFEDEPKKAVKLVSKVDESHPMFDTVQAIRTLSRLFSANQQLNELAQQHKSEAWQIYVRGIKALKKRQYDNALASWIEVLQLDRQLDDDGARKACVALFKLLGNEHEITKKYQRKFSSALLI